jgi:hypothetical protein
MSQIVTPSVKPQIGALTDAAPIIVAQPHYTFGMDSFPYHRYAFAA